MEKHLNYRKAAELLKGAKKILISGHISPDGDSLGSMIALATMLNNAGFEAYGCADIKSIGKLSFLKGMELILPLKKIKRMKFDFFIAVDCGSFDRMPQEVRSVVEGLKSICIDHHVTHEEFSDVTIIDPNASSAAELVWKFGKWMEWKFDSVIAEALWVGIVTDSGRFAYDNTSPATLRAAGDLLKYDVRTSYINDIIYNMYSLKAMKLRQIAWRSLRIWNNKKVAEVSITRDDFRAVRGTKADVEDVIEIPRSVARNEIALFFYQIPDRTKETRCSIRTRGDWDATVLAAQFGGGGHKKAAGCTIALPMAKAKRQLRKAVKQMLKNATGKRMQHSKD
jgi:phosphoesterase RecJ-like protein